MKQSAHEKVRKTVDMDTELANIIQDLADKRMWSFSQMSYVLLQSAVKEIDRQRKKNATKKVSS